MKAAALLHLKQPVIPATPASGMVQTPHDVLDIRFRAVGKWLAENVSNQGITLDLPNPLAGRGRTFFEQVLDDPSRLETRKFGGAYRRLWAGQDELVSTASVRELAKGAASVMHHPGTTNATLVRQQITRLFDNISRVRIPTQYTGLAGPVPRMQHPTSLGGGYFDYPVDSTRPQATPVSTTAWPFHFQSASSAASEHSRLDLERRERVVTAMEKAIQAPNATAESVVEAGVGESILFTVNEFMAPIRAQDVRPHALRGGAPAAVTRPQMRVREFWKSEGVQTLGLAQDVSQDFSETRAFGNRAGERALSPTRNVT